MTMRRLLTVLVLALALVACSSIPKQYSGPYGGTLTVIDINDPYTMQDVCWTDKWAQECTYRFTDNTCTIYIYTEASRSREFLMEHGIAHCNGWPANHSAAVRMAKNITRGKLAGTAGQSQCIGGLCRPPLENRVGIVF